MSKPIALVVRRQDGRRVSLIQLLHSQGWQIMLLRCGESLKQDLAERSIDYTDLDRLLRESREGGGRPISHAELVGSLFELCPDPEQTRKFPKGAECPALLYCEVAVFVRQLSNYFHLSIVTAALKRQVPVVGDRASRQIVSTALRNGGGITAAVRDQVNARFSANLASYFIDHARCASGGDFDGVVTFNGRPFSGPTHHS